jgi:hypothetical protein
VTHQGRNVVERTFALAKQWRALATRYDKLAITYRAAVVLSACITWTRIEKTRPSLRDRLDAPGTEQGRQACPRNLRCTSTSSVVVSSQPRSIDLPPTLSGRSLT